MTFSGPPTTRLAPSPTGALHLGNARTFLANWALARRRGWRVLLRIDDLEGPRVKAGADAQAVEDLRWLGLDWDGPTLYQSKRGGEYASALTKLTDAELVFGCDCSRREVGAASPRVAADGAPLYGGRCRSKTSRPDRRDGNDNAIRFRVPPATVAFDDEVAGPQSFDAETDLGDFVIRKAGGEYGYQLATVVDDAETGVTHVVRGTDLLASTPRQLLLYKALDWSNKAPTYAHLPLIVGPDGRKLAKRHGDTRLSQLRDEGVTAGQVRHLLATWSGFDPRDPRECPVEEWTERFHLARLPRSPVLYDDATQRPSS